MTDDIAGAWDRLSPSYQRSTSLPTDVVHYGPNIGTEADFRLLGDLRGKRVLELGCGGAQASIAFAKQGATAIAIDASAEQLAHAKKLADQEEVRVELRQGDLAQLSFLPADNVDLVFSAFAFQYVEDLGRVFRQVQRVLKVGSPFVFSIDHPAWNMFAEEPGSLDVVRSYYTSEIKWDWDGVPMKRYQHTFSDVYADLVRSGYRVDTILEPEPTKDGLQSEMWDDAKVMVPRTLIVRARKE